MKKERALTPEQQKLVEDNHNLIYFILRKMGLSDEEFYDVAAIGLCLAALYYKRSRETNFSTYAYHVVQREIKNEFAYRNAQKRAGIVIGFDEPMPRTTDLTIGETIRGDDTPETIAFANDLLEALNGLTKRQQKAMRLSIQGYTYPEIGSIIGGSPKAISMLINAARKTLRAEGYA